MKPVGLIVLGFGGHARSVADVALENGVRDLLFVTPTAQPGESWAGHPVLSALPESIPDGWQVFLAQGGNLLRRNAWLSVRVRSLELSTIIAHSASVSQRAIISPGVFIGHQAHVGPNATVGEGSILNTGSVTEHDAKIGSFAHISVNSTVAGYACVGDRTFIGAGATVIDKVSIGDDVTLGAGAVAPKDIVEPGVYVGVPARPLFRST